MDHAVQFLELVDATVMLVVEAQNGKRFWLSNGALRDEFREKGLSFEGEEMEELTPVLMSSRTEIYAVEEEVTRGDAIVEKKLNTPVSKIPPAPFLSAANAAVAVAEEVDVSNDDDDDLLEEFSEDNLICFSLKELSELKTERKKILAEQQAKKWKKGGGKSPRELALEEKEMKRTSKSIELVTAAIAAKREKDAAINDSHKRKLSSSSSQQPNATVDSKKLKISTAANAVSSSPVSTTSTSASKAAITTTNTLSSRSKSAVSTPSKTAPKPAAATPSESRALVATSNGSVTCHRCGLVGHIALDCKDDKEGEKLASTSEAEKDAASSVAEDVKPDVDTVVETASSTEIESATTTTQESSSSDKNETEASTVESSASEAQPQKKKSTPIKSATPSKKNSDFVCHYCNTPGHKKPFCYKMKDDLSKGITNGGFQSKGPPAGPPLGPPGPLPGLPQSIMGVPPPMQRPGFGPPTSGPGFGPPTSGPPPFNPGNLDEKTMVEKRLEGLRLSRGIRFSWSASECAFLVMMQDQQQRNDQIVKIGSLDQFLHVFGGN